MSDLRTTIGIGLGISLLIIILLGFFATSSRDIVMVFFGFAFGLISVFLLERMRIVRAH